MRTLLQDRFHFLHQRFVIRFEFDEFQDRRHVFLTVDFFEAIICGYRWFDKSHMLHAGGDLGACLFEQGLINQPPRLAQNQDRLLLQAASLWRICVKNLACHDDF